MSLPGLPDEVVAAFHAERLKKRTTEWPGREVAQFRRPSARPMSEDVKDWPTMIRSSSVPRVFFLSKGKSTTGPQGLAQNPNQVLTSESTVVCQPRGQPKAARNSNSCAVS
jgi:hypothetical protein